MNKTITLNGQPIALEPDLVTYENKYSACRGFFTKQKTFRLPCVFPDGRIKTIVTTEFVLAGVISEFIRPNNESPLDGRILRYVEEDKRKEFYKKCMTVDAASQPENIREIICPDINKIGYQAAEMIFDELKIEVLVRLVQPTTEEFQKMAAHKMLAVERVAKVSMEEDKSYPWPKSGPKDVMRKFGHGDNFQVIWWTRHDGHAVSAIKLGKQKVRSSKRQLFVSMLYRTWHEKRAGLTTAELTPEIYGYQYKGRPDWKGLFKKSKEHLRVWTDLIRLDGQTYRLNIK